MIVVFCVGLIGNAMGFIAGLILDIFLVMSQIII